MKRYIFFVLGIVLVLFGIAGLVLPLLQGILMILAGLVLIDEVIPVPGIAKLKKRLHRFREKHKKGTQKHSFWYNKK